MYSWKYICQENLKFTSQSSVSGEGLWVMGRPLPFDIPKTDGEPGVNAQEHRLGLDLGFPMKVTQKSCTRQCGRRNIWRLFGLWMDNYLPWCLTLVTCKQGQLSKFFFFFNEDMQLVELFQVPYPEPRVHLSFQSLCPDPGLTCRMWSLQYCPRKRLEGALVERHSL